MPLSSEERHLLLRFARHALTVVTASCPGRLLDAPVLPNSIVREVVADPGALSPALREPAGVFVTLHKAGELRGCVGLVETRLPLYEAVIDAAISAALRDPRFEPVTAHELSAMDIEVSVLSRPQILEPVVPERIRIGVHGLLITGGRHRGLLLPQVASERDWSPQRFLEETCRKAGLAADAWMHGAEVAIFQAEVFGEADEFSEER